MDLTQMDPAETPVAQLNQNRAVFKIWRSIVDAADNNVFLGEDGMDIVDCVAHIVANCKKPYPLTKVKEGNNTNYYRWRLLNDLTESYPNTDPDKEYEQWVEVNVDGEKVFVSSFGRFRGSIVSPIVTLPDAQAATQALPSGKTIGAVELFCRAFAGPRGQGEIAEKIDPNGRLREDNVHWVRPPVTPPAAAASSRSAPARSTPNPAAVAASSSSSSPRNPGAVAASTMPDHGWVYTTMSTSAKEDKRKKEDESVEDEEHDNKRRKEEPRPRARVSTRASQQAPATTTPISIDLSNAPEKPGEELEIASSVNVATPSSSASGGKKYVLYVANDCDMLVNGKMVYGKKAGEKVTTAKAIGHAATYTGITVDAARYAVSTQYGVRSHRSPCYVFVHEQSEREKVHAKVYVHTVKDRDTGKEYYAYTTEVGKPIPPFVHPADNANFQVEIEPFEEKKVDTGSIRDAMAEQLAKFFADHPIPSPPPPPPPPPAINVEALKTEIVSSLASSMPAGVDNRILERIHEEISRLSNRLEKHLADEAQNHRNIQSTMESIRIALNSLRNDPTNIHHPPSEAPK